MKAVILNAGQGRRLLPLTASRPKCLLPIGGKSVMEWQIQELTAVGIRDVTVVIGFGADKVKETLATACAPVARITTIYNPFYDVADNLVSCWVARDEMRDDFVLINGDTLFEAAVMRRLVASPPAPVTVAINRKHGYDADDMKVQCDGPFLRRIGKDLRPEDTDAESIGMLMFTGEGPRLFREALERKVSSQRGAKQWYLSAVGDLAERGFVRTVSVDGLDWTEIDFPHDLQNAMQLVASWRSPAEPQPLSLRVDA